MKNLRDQGSFGEGGGLGGGGAYCPNSLCLCSFLVPERNPFPHKNRLEDRNLLK